MFTLALAACSLAACSDDPAILERPDLGIPPIIDLGQVDRGVGDMPAVDLAAECVEDVDCDDGVDCTRDFCDFGNCRNQPDPAVCDDGVFCNGVEICDADQGGCAPGDPETCNDDDVCTIDRCDEEERLCRFSPRDFDGDGEADFNCEGGTDCNDFDPRRGSLINEICGDSVDNDCDDTVDEAECGAPEGNDCDAPIVVPSEGAFIEIDSSGATTNFDLECLSFTRKDLVFELTLAEARSLTVRAEGRSTTFVELRTACETGFIECQAGFPGTLRRRRLEPGTYYIVVADIGGDLAVEFDLDEPLPDPPNDTCSGAIDVSAGGTFEASFVDVANDGDTSCSTGSTDLFYTFTTTEVRDVVLSAVPSSGGTLGIAVTTACADATTEVACTRVSPASRRLYSLPAGTYFVSLESVSGREVSATFDVRFLAPTEPPAGDECRSALPIAITRGVPSTATGTLVGRQDDVDISCGFFYRDAVYSFELTERSDVTVTVDGAGTFMFASLRESCEDDATQLRCRSGNPSRSRVRNLLPGTYFVIVESFALVPSFEVTVLVEDPSDPTPVLGNDACGGAVVVPATGGLFSGSTLGLLNDYETRSFCGSNARSPDAAFELTLTDRRRVIANTDGSAYDTVLHLHNTTCVTEAEFACNDNFGAGATWSFLDRTLNPGTYFFVVDGFGASASGDYLLEIEVLEP
ncbi:MAG: hypothetical protein AAF447_18865 [Myxococcota bacterium]